MQYRLNTKRNLTKQIERLSSEAQTEIRKILVNLVHDPIPEGAAELYPGLVGHYKLKIEQWRLVYEVHEDVIILLALKLEPVLPWAKKDGEVKDG